MRRTLARHVFVLAPLALAAGLALTAHRAATPCYALRQAALPAPGTPLVSVGGLVETSSRHTRDWFDMDNLDVTCRIGPFDCDYHGSSYHSRPYSGTLHLSDPRSCDGGSIAVDLGMYTTPREVELRRDERSDLHLVSPARPSSSGARPIAFHRAEAGVAGRLAWRLPALIPLLFAAVVVAVDRSRVEMSDGLRWAALGALGMAISLLASG